MMLPASFLPIATVSGELPLRHHDVSIIALAVLTTVGLIAGVLATWAVMRRRPPIEREIDDRIAEAIRRLDHDWKQNFAALREEVHELNHERRVTIGRLFDKVDAYRAEAAAATKQLQQSVEEGFKDLHRVIGQLEGRAGK